MTCITLDYSYIKLHLTFIDENITVLSHPNNEIMKNLSENNKIDC